MDVRLACRRQSAPVALATDLSRDPSDWDSRSCLPTTFRLPQTVSAGNSQGDRGALPDVTIHLESKRATEQTLQSSPQKHQCMHLRTFRKEDLFDFPRRHSLPVIANAHLQPPPGRTYCDAQPPSAGRRLESMLHRILDQRLHRERWY